MIILLNKLTDVDVKSLKRKKVEEHSGDLDSSSGSSVQRSSGSGNSVKRSRRAAPKNLSEKDSIGENLSSASELEDNGHSDHSSDYHEPEEKEVETQNGSLGIVFHGIIKREKVLKPVKCSVCAEEKRSTRQLNKHMKEQHPDFKYICETCERPFDTYNAWYRHSEHHFELRYGCTECNKRFQFPYQQRNHIKLHTKKGMIPCTWPKCTKLFTCNKYMFQHLQAHTEQTWECTECDPKKVYQMLSNYKQHQKGFHGEGFKSPCGKVHKWPYLRNKHNKECDTCIASLTNTKPVNPRHAKLK